MVIPVWALPGRSVVERFSNGSCRSGVILDWRDMADRKGLFPLIQWSNLSYGVSFANPDWIEPPQSPFSTFFSELIQIGSTVKLIYPDQTLGNRSAIVVDLCSDQAEVEDEEGTTTIYALQDLMLVKPALPIPVRPPSR